MEHIFYLTVKVLIMAYMLHEVYRIFFGEQGEWFFRFLTPKPRAKNEANTSAMVSERSRTTLSASTSLSNREDNDDSIVGKSQTIYLEAPPEEKPIEPVFSEDLPRVPAYEEEPDISSDDVEVHLDETLLTEEDRFMPLDVEPDNEFNSSGMTFEQIGQAIEVVQGIRTSDADKSAVARTLYEIEGSDLFNILALQAENETMIERLLKENLDDAGEILPDIEKKKRKGILDFDMEKYV